MIGVKQGVRLNGMAAQVLLALVVVEGVLRRHDAGDAVLTSVIDGRHSRGSLHYVGHAIDLRTRTIPLQIRQIVVEEIRLRLGEEFDVVVESDHLHVEWQPKGE